MRRTWLIISDGGLAGFDAEAPSLALTIDRGCPVYWNGKTPFDDLIPLDQNTWDVDNVLRGHAMNGSMVCRPG